MKKTFFAIMVALLAVASVCAQPQGRGHRHGSMNPGQMIERRVAMLDKELSLTPDQKTAIAAIYTEQAEKMKAKMEQKRADKDNQVQPKPEDMKARREAMKAEQDEVDNKVAQLLTAEQKAKFEQVKAKRAERGHDNKGMRHRGPKHEDGKAPSFKGKADCDKKAECCKDNAKADCCNSKVEAPVK